MNNLRKIDHITYFGGQNIIASRSDSTYFYYRHPGFYQEVRTKRTPRGYDEPSSIQLPEIFIRYAISGEPSVTLDVDSSIRSTKKYRKLSHFFDGYCNGFPYNGHLDENTDGNQGCYFASFIIKFSGAHIVYTTLGDAVHRELSVNANSLLGRKLIEIELDVYNMSDQDTINGLKVLEHGVNYPKPRQVAPAGQIGDTRRQQIILNVQKKKTSPKAVKSVSPKKSEPRKPLTREEIMADPVLLELFKFKLKDKKN